MKASDRPATDDWRLGLDLGSTAAKAVLLDPKGVIKDYCLLPSGAAAQDTARQLAETLLSRNGVVSARRLATGYGRSLAGGKTVTEITCHARGVRYLHPDAASVLDIGGQDAKAIRLGADGGVEDFAMNDRCAAGTGCFLEVAARKFSVAIEDLSGFCGDDPAFADAGKVDPFEISSTCVVFAESELVGLAARGVPAVESLRAVHRAIARRVTLLLKQVGAVEPLYFTGGVAANQTLAKAVGNECGLVVKRADMAQFAGALGAALLA